MSKKGKKTSRFPFVYWDSPRSKWLVMLRIHKKAVFGGRYDDEINAAIAVNVALAILFPSEGLSHLVGSRVVSNKATRSSFEAASETERMIRLMRTTVSNDGKER